MVRCILISLLIVGMVAGCIGRHDAHNRQVMKFSCDKHAVCGFDHSKIEARYCVQCGEPLPAEHEAK